MAQSYEACKFCKRAVDELDHFCEEEKGWICAECILKHDLKSFICLECDKLGCKKCGVACDNRDHYDVNYVCDKGYHRIGGGCHEILDKCELCGKKLCDACLRKGKECYECFNH